eukprot:TRINITY_DN14984_c0_g1_i1.p1 TRINITY_DN14984_c0_g1~~TRINITY_DN14984_c0_g1_i1.p1  ORF type:complete len:149 (+),score=21.66 TRINITY_DN14984_c0_g1_i1:37-483(+)
MSSGVIWSVVRKHHAALRVDRSTKSAFSGEAGNLVNLQKKRSSGYAQSKAIDIQPARNGKKQRGVRVGFKQTNLRKPSRQFSSQITVRDSRRVLPVLENASKNYKNSQVRAALVRFSRLNRGNNTARRNITLKKAAQKQTGTQGQNVD